MSKHSPGPWVHEYRDGNHVKNVSHKGWGSNGLWDAKGNLILGTGPGWDAAYQEPKKKEDWLLIQAAPKMLKWLTDFYNDPGMIPDLDELKELIEEAGGEVDE